MRCDIFAPITSSKMEPLGIGFIEVMDEEFWAGLELEDRYPAL